MRLNDPPPDPDGPVREDPPAPDEITAETSPTGARTTPADAEGSDPYPVDPPPARATGPVFKPRPSRFDEGRRGRAIDPIEEDEEPLLVKRRSRRGPGPFAVGLMAGLLVLAVIAVFALVPGLFGGSGRLTSQLPAPNPQALTPTPLSSAQPPAENWGTTVAPIGRPADGSPQPGQPAAVETAQPVIAQPATPAPVTPRIPQQPGLYGAAPDGTVVALTQTNPPSLPPTAVFYRRGAPADPAPPELYPVLLLPTMPNPPAAPREQWPVAYFLNAWAGFDAHVRDALTVAPGAAPQGRALGLRREADTGEADLQRLVPLQPLPPGLYQLGPQERFFVDRPGYATIRAESVAAMLREGDINRALASAAVAARLSEPGDAERLARWRTDWATALTQVLREKRDLPLNQSLALARQLEGWGNADTATALARQRIELAKAQAGGDLRALMPVLREAQELGYAEATPATFEALAAQVQQLGRTGALELQPVQQFVAAATPLRNDPDRRNTPTVLLALGLEDLLHGEEAAAFVRLRQITQQNPTSPEARVAQLVLAPPQPGVKPVPNIEPLVLEDADARPALELALTKVEVGRDQMQLIFRVRNVGPRGAALLYPAPGPAPALRLRDDQGATIDSTTGFIGGRQSPLDPARPEIYRIDFASGEQTLIAARFPLPSLGATTVEFISPPVRGQGEWRWPEIKIRAPFFEPPLATDPLPGNQLTSLPSLQPVDVARANTTVGAAAPDDAESSAAGQGDGGERDPLPLRPAVVLEDEAAPASTTGDATARRITDPDRYSLELTRQRADEARAAFLATRREGAALSNGLYRAGEEQRSFAKRLEDEGELDRAAFYYEQAARIYRRAASE